MRTKTAPMRRVADMRGLLANTGRFWEWTTAREGYHRSKPQASSRPQALETRGSRLLEACGLRRVPEVIAAALARSGSPRTGAAWSRRRRRTDPRATW